MGAIGPAARGDTDRVQRMKAEGAAELAALMQKFAKIM
jgi:hypothetical protein